MIDDLITRGFRHLFGPIRNITEIQFDHIPAGLADDMVMVILQLTKLVFDIRPVDHFEDEFQGFEEIQRPIDGRQSNFSLLFEKGLINFQRAQGTWGTGKFSVNQKSRMTQTELLLSKNVSKKSYIHHKLRKE
jgi:hypothetical protein